MSTMKIHEGSILEVEADIIVNPANSFLQHAGGLAAVIAREAIGPLSPKDSGDARDTMVPDEVGAAWAAMQHGRIPTGSAVFHPPGHLAERGFKGVVHAVGPIWGGGKYKEIELLSSAYRRACEEACLRGYKSIVFPAISAGIFGMPIRYVAHAALEGCLGLDVTFALTDPEHVKEFERVIYTDTDTSKWRS